MNSQQLQSSSTITATSTTTATTIGHNVMERASAEITKRINGLTLRSKSSNTANGPGVTSGSGFFGGNQQQSHSIKTSMIDRMTNVFCSNVLAPDKPSRVLLTPSKSVKSSMVLKKY